MMIALLLYCWSRGVRSSRAIERACVEDVACRVIAAQQRPDHATIARFVVRHERALGELFGEVLDAVRRRRPGDGRGDRDRRHQGRTPTPAATARWTTSSSPRRSSRKRSRPTPPRPPRSASAAATSCPRSSRPAEGPRGLAARRAPAARPASAPSEARADPALTAAAAAARPSAAWRRSSPSSATPTQRYEAYRARGVMKDGRRFGAPAQALHAAGDSRRQGQPHRSRLQAGARHARLGPGLQRPGRLQRAAPDPRRRGHDRLTGLRAPRPDARRRPRASSPPPASPQRPTSCVADAGYWHLEQMNEITGDGIPVLIPPDSSRRATSPRDPAGTAAPMTSCAPCSRPSAAASSTSNARS